jgi:hypothetical protein
MNDVTLFPFYEKHLTTLVPTVVCVLRVMTTRATEQMFTTDTIDFYYHVVTQCRDNDLFLKPFPPPMSRQRVSRFFFEETSTLGFLFFKNTVREGYYIHDFRRKK